MNRIATALALAPLVALSGAAAAQQAKSLTDLLREKYLIVGAANNFNFEEHYLYLQKDTEVYVCFLSSMRGRKGCLRAN